ncbi:MAG: type II toxin-antitoxin system VapC family toxin [Caldilineaceae bacterium]|nr:type II toxin-antitoxin system VapC family toxin [Caldilineaceae bacterium]
MSGYLLDTNVVSEIFREAPDLQVRSFLAEQEDLWLSVVALHELEFGLNLLPRGRRREDLRTALSSYVEAYADFILPVTRTEAEQAALLRVQAQRGGRVLHLADALIAGTAIVHNLMLATRNVKDFAALDVDVVNPWELS